MSKVIKFLIGGSTTLAVVVLGAAVLFGGVALFVWLVGPNYGAASFMGLALFIMGGLSAVPKDADSGAKKD